MSEFSKAKGQLSAKMVEMLDAIDKLEPERLSIFEIEQALSLCSHFSEGILRRIVNLQKIITDRKTTRPHLTLMQR